MLLAAALLAGCTDSGDDGDAGGVAITTSPTSAVIPSQSTSDQTAPVAVYGSPFIDRVAWASTDQGASLQVFPTDSGRNVPGETQLDAAWSEVVALDQTADSPGMYAQFACHWRFARIAAPDKTSWNLEPWRPVVSASQMIATRCNPGGPEEQIP